MKSASATSPATSNPRLKIYELYAKWNGYPSPFTMDYAKGDHTTWNVAAFSLKQAIFLAARKEWSTGGPGIVEQGTDCWEAKWRGISGEWVHRFPLLTGQPSRRLKKGELARALEAIEEAIEGEMTTTGFAP